MLLQKDAVINLDESYEKPGNYNGNVSEKSFMYLRELYMST